MSAARSALLDLRSLFANVGFGVSLLGLWALLTMIGVLVEQGKDATFYFNQYPAELARIVLRLDLNNIYHSTGYVAVIGLVLASMWTATFVRVIPRRMPRLHPVKIDAIPLHATIAAGADAETARERVAAFFTARGWKVRKRAFGGTEWTFADRHDWARTGVLVAHVGFLVIAIGTTIYWATGFDGAFTVLSGRTATIPRSGATVTLKSFGYRIDPVTTKSGVVFQPIDYVSHAVVTGRDGVPRDAVIRVNHPYNVDGTDVYQATYGFAIDFRLTKDGRDVPLGVAGPLQEGQGFPIAGSGRAIQYLRFIGTIDRRTGTPAADPRPNDPGVVVRAFDGDRQLGDALIPLGPGGLDLGNGWRISAQRYTLYSGFQYRYDPGILVVGAGAIVLVLGLCIAVYVVPARLFVRVDDDGGAATVGVAATTVRVTMSSRIASANSSRRCGPTSRRPPPGRRKPEEPLWIRRDKRSTPPCS